MTTEADALSAALVLRALLAPLVERIDQQDETIRAQAERITALEQRPVGVIDAGVWVAGKTYPAGVGCTWDGHFWTAQRANAEQPGEGSSAWRLAVRRGKPGREGREGKPGRDALEQAS